MYIISINSELINQGLKKIFEDVDDMDLICQLQLDLTISDQIDSVFIIGLSRYDDVYLEHFHKQKQKCVILLDTKFDRPTIHKLHGSSINGFLSLESDKEEILTCVSQSNKGIAHYPQEISKLFLSDSIKLNQFKLSERECEILELLSQGKTLQEISEDLFLSKNTVVTHKRNVLKKTGFNKMTQLVAWWKGAVV